jgi:hypothetical protein
MKNQVKRTYQSLLLLLLLSGASFPSTVDHPPADYCKPQKTNYSSYEDSSAPLKFFFREIGRTIHCNRDDVSAAASLIIAAFTIVLGSFTVSLARSTRKAAYAAKKAADVSEQALTVLERPYLLIEEPIISRDHLITQAPHEELRYKFTNYGKTPAIVRFMEAVIRIGDSPSPFWEPFNGRIIVGAGEEKPIPIVNPRPIPDQTAVPVVSVFLTITITYWDVFDWVHVNEFSFFRMGNRFVPIGGNENNRRYSRKLRDGEEWSLEWSRKVLSDPQP